MHLGTDDEVGGTSLFGADLFPDALAKLAQIQPTPSRPPLLLLPPPGLRADRPHPRRQRLRQAGHPHGQARGETAVDRFCLTPSPVDRSALRFRPSSPRARSPPPWPDTQSSRTSSSARGAQDKIRSKLFSKLSRDITLAAKQGVPDPTANARLRLAIANAKAESMPKDNIDRAIKKALGGEADTDGGDPLRGLRPRRRRPDRRGADRQPQPRRRQCAHHLRQERRQPGRDRLGGVHVRPPGRDHLSAARPAPTTR